MTSAGTLRLTLLSSTLVAATVAAGGLPQSPAVRVTPGPPQPAKWIAFSAELRIEHPDRPTAFGRFLQDEHGCAVEDRKDVLRVRVMRNAQKRGPGRVEGDVIDEIEFPFTGVGTTTKLAENFSVTLMRIGARKLR